MPELLACLPVQAGDGFGLLGAAEQESEGHRQAEAGCACSAGLV
jgi:hypothetical protein